MPCCVCLALVIGLVSSVLAVVLICTVTVVVLVCNTYRHYKNRRRSSHSDSSQSWSSTSDFAMPRVIPRVAAQIPQKRANVWHPNLTGEFSSASYSTKTQTYQAITRRKPTARRCNRFSQSYALACHFLILTRRPFSLWNSIMEIKNA